MANSELLEGIAVEERYTSNFENLTRSVVVELEKMVATGAGEKAELDTEQFAARLEKFAPGQSEQIKAKLLEFVRGQRIAACTNLDDLTEMIQNWRIPLSVGKDEFGNPVQREPVLGEHVASRVDLVMEVVIESLPTNETDASKIRAEIMKESKVHGFPPSWNGLRAKFIELMTAQILEQNKPTIESDRAQEWQPPATTRRDETINRLMTPENVRWLFKNARVGMRPTQQQMDMLWGSMPLVPDDLSEHTKVRQALWDNRDRLT